MRCCWWWRFHINICLYSFPKKQEMMMAFHSEEQHWDATIECLLQALVEDDVFNGRSDKIQRTFLLWCWFKMIYCGFIINKTCNCYWFLNNDVTTTYVFTNDVSLQSLPRYLKNNEKECLCLHGSSKQKEKQYQKWVFIVDTHVGWILNDGLERKVNGSSPRLADSDLLGWRRLSTHFSF